SARGISPKYDETPAEKIGAGQGGRSAAPPVAAGPALDGVVQLLPAAGVELADAEVGALRGFEGPAQGGEGLLLHALGDSRRGGWAGGRRIRMSDDKAGPSCRAKGAQRPGGCLGLGRGGREGVAPLRRARRSEPMRRMPPGQQ